MDNYVNINNFLNSVIIKNPFPYICIDNFLDENIVFKIKDDILNIDKNLFINLNNEFEKNQLNFRHELKNKLPQLLKNLFEYFNSSQWLKLLSEKFNISYIEGDKNMYLWGIHTYNSGGRLQTHLDAKICPITKREKIITCCIYLSDNWKEDYGGELILWNSDNYKVKDINKSVSPIFNRCIFFLANEKSFHSVNEIAKHIPKNSIRILVTMSFYKSIDDNRLTAILNYNRPFKLEKAMFV